MSEYRGFEITPRSIVGGTNISEDGEYVDFVLGGFTEARYEIDRIIAEREAETHEPD